MARKTDYGLIGFPPGTPAQYEPVRLNAESPEKITELASALSADGCIKAITVAGGKMDVPPEEVNNFFGERQQYVTQIEIRGAGREGVYFHVGYYEPQFNIVPYCNIVHYDNWNFGKEGKSPEWHRYIKGN